MEERAGNRWSGGLVLGVAILMLALGQTLLRSHLTGITYIVYWLVCIVSTCLALLLAFLDLQRLRHRSREQQRELIEDTLKNLPEAEDR